MAQQVDIGANPGGERTAVLTLWASLERFDWDQFKAAMDLGATPSRTFFRITLPLILPGILAAFLLSFALSIDESRVERPQSGSERGAGIRVIDGEVTRFAHVDGLAEEDLMRAADGLASALGGDATEPLALKADFFRWSQHAAGKVTGDLPSR